MIDGIKVFREGIAKQMEGLRLQDESLAIVQEAVAKHHLGHQTLCWMLLWWAEGVLSLIL